MSVKSEFREKLSQCKHEWQQKGRALYCPKCGAILESIFGSCLQEKSKGKIR